MYLAGYDSRSIDVGGIMGIQMKSEYEGDGFSVKTAEPFLCLEGFLYKQKRRKLKGIRK